MSTPLNDRDWERFEEMRNSRPLGVLREDAGRGDVIARPDDLINRTVGILDATSC